MSTITGIARKMHGGIEFGVYDAAKQAQYLTSFNKPEEYLKHATHRRNLGLEPLRRKPHRRGRKKEKATNEQRTDQT